jgi:hypothetical protein
MIPNKSDSSNRAGAPELGTAPNDDTSAATGVEGSVCVSEKERKRGRETKLCVCVFVRVCVAIIDAK